MGLDMYLYKKFFVKNYDFYKKADINEVIVKKGGVERNDIENEKISEVTLEVMYWRKANAIHNWFVVNCCEGEDDCKENYVSVEDLKNLYKICCEVLEESELINGKVHNGTEFKNGKVKEIYEDGKLIKDPTKAKDLLPTVSGCFFGGTDYDGYYYEDVKETKEMLEKELNIKNNQAEYYYRASW